MGWAGREGSIEVEGAGMVEGMVRRRCLYLPTYLDAVSGCGADTAVRTNFGYGYALLATVSGCAENLQKILPFLVVIMHLTCALMQQKGCAE